MGRAAPDAEASWRELFRGTTGVYVLLLNLGVLLYGTDLYLLFTLMPSVVKDLGGVAYYSWAVMFFIVSAIIGSASYGPLRVLFGGRTTYVAGGLIYLAATAGCALAPDIGFFLAARLVDGFGGGLVMAGSMAYTSALFTARIRPRAIALTSMTWIAGSLAGPVIGGAFGALGTWRGAFWALMPLILLFICMVLWRIPGGTDAVARASGRRFPFGRLCLLGLGVVCVAAAGRVDNDPLRVALIAASVGAFWATVRLDASAKSRLFPTRPFSLTSTVGLGYWTQLLVGGLYTSIAIYLPLVLQSVYGLAALYLGAMNAVTSVCWSIASSGTSGFTGARARFVIRLGPMLIVTGIAILALTAGGLSLAVMAFASVIIGLGVGMNYVHTLSTTMGAARAGEESITASSLQTMRNLGIAFGSAASGVVATLAGLEADAAPAVVADAVTWVYLFLLVPAAVMVIIGFRFVGATRAPLPAAAE